MATTIRRTDPAYAASATADFHGLPLGRLTARGDAAHIFTGQIADLATWLNARGGYTTRERAGLDVALWTLRTTTEPRGDGTTTTVHVHALALTHEDIPHELTAALA
ncbi:hypothetical protein [Streptomyces sp. NPDC058297]|uniref:hypothetical protein n=1 Tax=Streptomyces sp. NPDC058297 TaxID=3346433 RepID=UPI0036E07F87